MQGNTDRYAKTDPVINGGSYRRTDATGRVVWGLMMGVTELPPRKEGDGPRIEGSLYTQLNGPTPIHVVEDTESMMEWELVSCPAATAANHAKGRHRKE